MEDGGTDSGRDETYPPQSMCPDSGPSCPSGSRIQKKGFGPSLEMPTSSSLSYSLPWASLRPPVGLPGSEQVQQDSIETGGVNTKWQNPQSPPLYRDVIARKTRGSGMRDAG